MSSSVLSPSAAIRAIDLVRSYGSASAPVHALRGVSFEVRRGERVALLGKSGSGKSTLLNVLGGLDRPSSGSAEVEGRDLARMNTDELARHRLATVGIIFQSFHLIPSRTALENVELPMVFAGRSRGQRREAARRALETVGLGHRLTHRPAELSGGEHQRVAVARALVNDPTVLLADEPTGNLDSATAAEIMALIIDHVRRHGTTLILVTHDEELARGCTDRVLRLRDGQLVP
jgi:predicted ABC-type transport system involved in lysophospholipase L1 biosynthesis ATPase subunit